MPKVVELREKGPVTSGYADPDPVVTNSPHRSACSALCRTSSARKPFIQSKRASVSRRAVAGHPAFCSEVHNNRPCPCVARPGRSATRGTWWFSKRIESWKRGLRARALGRRDQGRSETTAPAKATRPRRGTASCGDATTSGGPRQREFGRVLREREAARDGLGPSALRSHERRSRDGEVVTERLRRGLSRAVRSTTPAAGQPPG